MSDHDPDATVAHYEQVESWSIGQSGAPDAERITVSGGRALLLGPDGAQTVPAVQWCLPETPRSAAREDCVEPDVAEAFGRYLILAADAARARGATS